MKALDEATRSKLTKVAGMFGSPFDGEAANAARAFDDTLKAKGLTLSDLLAVDPLAGFNWRELASLACCNAKALNAKELAFAADMFHRNKPPSAKQEAWLRSIAKRFESEVR